MFPEKPGVMASARAHRRRRRLQLQPPRQEPEEDRRLFRPRRQGRGAPTSTPSSSTSRTTTPNGTTASAGATTRAIMPKEVADAGAGNWKNVNGTGPFMLTDFVPGNSNTYVKNPDYWDKEKIGGAEYKLPFVDKIAYRTIKDEATYITALRTGKLDILETIRWQNVDELKKSAPQLQVVNRWLNMSGTFLAMRVDTEAVRRHPRAPRAQHGGQQAGDRQGLLQRQCRAVRLSAASRLHRLLRAAGGDAGLGQGAVHLQPGQGQEAAGRSRAIRRASPSRCRSARASPTTWTCCRWSRPISSRSASRSRSSRWSTARSCRR